MWCTTSLTSCPKNQWMKIRLPLLPGQGCCHSFSVNFFTPKLMKIRWSSLFFGSFAPHFQIKLSIHSSNFNSRFVSMSELELFLLTGILTPNFNTMDLVKILEKNQKLHIQIVAVTLKVTSYKTMRKTKRSEKK
jgi:hypothetical protein